MSAARNAVALGFELPASVCTVPAIVAPAGVAPALATPADVVVHQVGFAEHDGFRCSRQQSSVSSAETFISAHRIGLAIDGEILSVTHMGHPWRRMYSPPRTVARLVSGTWGRLVTNGRRAGEDVWEYSRLIYNIHVGAPPKPDVFIATQPASIANDERMLR